MRISDWSSDVCSSDLRSPDSRPAPVPTHRPACARVAARRRNRQRGRTAAGRYQAPRDRGSRASDARDRPSDARSEEHTSELQSLMRISYAVFCLKTKKQEQNTNIEDKTSNTLKQRN